MNLRRECKCCKTKRTLLNNINEFLKSCENIKFAKLGRMKDRRKMSRYTVHIQNERSIETNSKRNDLLFF